MCVQDGKIRQRRGTLFLVNPKMATQPIPTKVISFESSHQLPPAHAKFNGLAQRLGPEN